MMACPWKKGSRLSGAKQSLTSPFMSQNQNSQILTLPALGYETSTFELNAALKGEIKAWEIKDIRRNLKSRADLEKARCELHVYYYRINHTLAFPLPVASRPAQMPPGIPRRAWYPWMIWLSWSLEERWRVLHGAWRLLDDARAGALLQAELAALDGWTNFGDWNDEPGLPTAHLAACLSISLSDSSGWEPSLYARCQSTAHRLIEQDILPWFRRIWEGKEIQPAELANIPVIILMRVAELARVIRSPHAEILNQYARDFLCVWREYRMDSSNPHTEGFAYDGYLMNACLGWTRQASDQEELLLELRDAFASLVRQWVFAALPGRPDLQAPLGDVEPEMPFWTTCLLLLALWYPDDPLMQEGRWLTGNVFPSRLPAEALELILQHAETSFSKPGIPPTARICQVANAIVFRSGWEHSDVSVAISKHRSTMSHLHNDNGHLLVGWRGRFWITDPGYQQYRSGDERDFTLDQGAHNIPVLNGCIQSRRDSHLVQMSDAGAENPHVTLDLTECYEGLSDESKILRTVHFQRDAILIHDEFWGLASDTEIATHWLGGAHLAWAFVDGWARLSDGEAALWIGVSSGPITAAMLERHSGSRGPLTLRYIFNMSHQDSQSWYLLMDRELRWKPPVNPFQKSLRKELAGKRRG